MSNYNQLRNKEIVELHEIGWSLPKLAMKYHITKQRVSEIYHRDKDKFTVNKQNQSL